MSHLNKLGAVRPDYATIALSAAEAVTLEKRHMEAAPNDIKRPLFRALPPSPVFPIEAMGDLQPAAQAIHARTQAPLAICAQSVLAAATLAIQAHHDVDLPNAGIKPLTAFFMSVAESGERKSSVDRLALRPVYQAEERFRQDYEAARKCHVDELEAWEEARAQAKKKANGNREAIVHAFETIGPQPKAPPLPMILVSDPTAEALVLHLEKSRPWAGLFTDEGGGFVGGHAMNDDNRMKTGALLNALWDGSPIRRVRVGTGSTFLPGRRCSAHVMCQPVVAAQFLGDETLSGLGTVARVLVVAPETTAGTRLYRDAPDRLELTNWPPGTHKP